MNEKSLSIGEPNAVSKQEHSINEDRWDQGP
jgi:hypothetical protein